MHACSRASFPAGNPRQQQPPAHTAYGRSSAAGSKQAQEEAKEKEQAPALAWVSHACAGRPGSTQHAGPARHERPAAIQGAAALACRCCTLRCTSRNSPPAHPDRQNMNRRNCNSSPAGTARCAAHPGTACRPCLHPPHPPPPPCASGPPGWPRRSAGWHTCAAGAAWGRVRARGGPAACRRCRAGGVPQPTAVRSRAQSAHAPTQRPAWAAARRPGKEPPTIRPDMKPRTAARSPLQSW